MKSYMDTPWNQLPLSVKAAERISPLFYLGDLIKSDTAIRRNIDNNFEKVEHLQNAVFLAREILTPIRNRFGSITLNSVYRSQRTERALKNMSSRWVSKSQHARGQAADIEVFGVSNLMLADWIKHNLKFDHLILECYNARQGPNSGWVHVSVVPMGPNRGLVQSYVKSRGKFRYVSGLL